MYIDRCTPLVEQMQQRVNTRVPPVIPDLRFALEKTIYQMILFGEQCTLEAIMKHLPLCSCTRWFDDADALDVTPRDGNKCSGIRHVLAHYGIDPSDAAAVGDGLNDVEMLRMVGMGVAMGNACTQTKRVAKYVAPDLEADGLCRAVAKILEG